MFFLTLKYVNDVIQYPFTAESVRDFLIACLQSLPSFTSEKVQIRRLSLIDILSAVPRLTCLELWDPVTGSFIPYCLVSQVLAAHIGANPMFLPDLEAVEFIWEREYTAHELERALMATVGTCSTYGKLKDVAIGRLRKYEELSVDTNHRLAALKRG